MFNKVMLMGRLTRDPELRYTSDKTPMCNFTIAIDDGYGENQTTNFINCVAWGKTAEFLCNYFLKGQMIIVEGKLRSRSWEGSDEKKRYSMEVNALSLDFGERKATAQ